MSFKLHNSDQIEGIEIKLSDYPIAFENRCKEVVEQGLAKDMEEARKMCKDETIYLEVYYEKDYGCFAIDSLIVDSLEEELISPYSGENATKADDE